MGFRGGNNNRSFGDNRGRGGSRGGFRGGNRGGGRGGSFGGGNRSFGGGGNRSFGGGDVQKRSSFGGGRGGGNRGRGFGGSGKFQEGRRGGSFGGKGDGGSFFKKQQNGQQQKGFSLKDNRKRKFGSDSEDDEMEIVEQPKSIMKTPRLDITKSDKKVTMNAANNSFQAKTPATPHPKSKQSATTPRQKPTLNFDDDDEDISSDEEIDPALAEKGAGKPLKDLVGDDSAEDSDMDDDLESYEDMSDEDGMSDLEDEDGDLAHLAGAEDSDDSGEDEMDLENLEDLEKDTSEESEGEPVTKPTKADKSAAKVEKPATKVEKAPVKAEENGKASKSNLPPNAAQAEQKTRLGFFKCSLFVPDPSDQLSQRKKLGTVHPFLTSARTHGKGLMLTFDSESSRNNAIKWFKSHQEPELRSLNIVKAEEDKSLQAEASRKVDLTKLEVLHVPERVNKHHFKVVFPSAESVDMPTGGSATISFKSTEEAQKSLNASVGLKLLGAPVLVTFHSSK